MVDWLAGKRAKGTSSERTGLGTPLAFTDTTVSKTGVKVYYNFEQTSGSLTNQATTGNGFSDGLGSSLDATVTGSPTRTTTGKLGSYATTGVNGAYFTLPNTSGNSSLAFLSNSSFSLSFWIKKASSGVGGIIGSASGSGGWSGYTLSLDPSTGNMSYFRRASNGGAPYGEQVSYSGAITDTDWHHVIITGTSSSGGAKLYIDGSEKTFSINYGDSMSGSAYHQSNLTLFGYGSSFVGTNSESEHTLDEFVIFNRTLSSAEASTLYDEQALGVPNTQDGTIFEETDTNKAYIWSSSSQTWTQL